MLMTPKIVARSWNLTSVIRNPDQRDEILQAGKNGPGQVTALVASLDDVKSEGDARKILEDTKPDWVIWSAGAGGKGGASRTYAIDRDACSAFIRAIIGTPSVKKFLLISAVSIRRNPAPWFTDEDWAAVVKGNNESLPDYYKAKLASEDVLTVLAEERRKNDSSFQWVSLRPGTLTDDSETGRVSLGRTAAKGKVAREDVAEVAVRLLDDGRVNGWIDLLSGEEEVGEAVEKVAKDLVSSMEGDDLEVMKRSIA